MDPKYLRGLAPEDEPDTYESEGTAPRQLEYIMTKPDDSVHVIDIDFDSAYTAFREKSHLGFFDNAASICSEEGYSSVDPNVLLERYKSSLKECKQIERILFALKDQNSEFKENVFDALLDIQKTNAAPIKGSGSRREEPSASSNNIGGSDSVLMHKFKLLEDRIATLENIIGLQDSMMAQLTVGIEDKTVLGTLRNFQSKIDALNPTIVSEAELRLSRLIEKMSESSADKIRDAFEDSKLRQLSEQIENNQLALDLIPHLLRRLESLGFIHKKAREFDDSLNIIENSQSQLKETVDTNRELLKRLQINLQENMAQLQALLDSKVKERVND